MSTISPLPYRTIIKKLHKEIKTETLRNILRQAEVSEKDFLGK